MLPVTLVLLKEECEVERGQGTYLRSHGPKGAVLRVLARIPDCQLQAPKWYTSVLCQLNHPEKGEGWGQWAGVRA